MKSIGWLLVVLGAGSFALNFAGMEFKYLMWIDNWGTEIGWAMRGGLIVVGGVLLFVAMKSGTAAETPGAQTARVEPEPTMEPVEHEIQGLEPHLSTERE